MKRDAPRKQARALVRDTARSQQLFCIEDMAKEPPATDEGSLLLVG
jgi:hypothetical protein